MKSRDPQYEPFVLQFGQPVALPSSDKDSQARAPAANELSAGTKTVGENRFADTRGTRVQRETTDDD